MDLSLLLTIIIGGIFINNYVFARFFGLCSFVGVSQNLNSSVGMSFAVVFVMTLSSSITWIIYNFILLPLNMNYMNTLVFVLVIAALVQFVEMFLKKTIPSLYRSLGVYLPLITTNCAVLAVALLNIQEKYNFIASTLNGFFSAVGYSVALILLAGIREQIVESKVPVAFRGVALAFVTGGLLALAFMGFSGMKL